MVRWFHRLPIYFSHSKIGHRCWWWPSSAAYRASSLGCLRTPQSTLDAMFLTQLSFQQSSPLSEHMGQADFLQQHYETNWTIFGGFQYCIPQRQVQVENGELPFSSLWITVRGWILDWPWACSHGEWCDLYFPCLLEALETFGLAPTTLFINSSCFDAIEACLQPRQSLPTNVFSFLMPFVRFVYIFRMGQVYLKLFYFVLFCN